MGVPVAHIPVNGHGAISLEVEASALEAAAPTLAQGIRDGIQGRALRGIGVHGAHRKGGQRLVLQEPVEAATIRTASYHLRKRTTQGKAAD
eukprot:CAMPEP_0171116392 /NCGR_PEP_ID=MMETSP0766_2-20121228/90169_1 /TAXON_ID=439317 /ORGANISM="Gambierdiscus australes, Strain CAWD 149" /LENGTH=90 /DNA_ID=CAMNT_0011578827 /DNA_START=504 /DNA_END=773 /DNA_ORIENTATION=+